MVETGKKSPKLDSVNNSNSNLLNTGWVWHPYGIIEIYNINDEVKDNSIFDQITSTFPTNAEICFAEFLTDDIIVVSSTTEELLNHEKTNSSINLNPGQIGLYPIKRNTFLKKNC